MKELNSNSATDGTVGKQYRDSTKNTATTVTEKPL
jgi:hypothetical protein